MRMYDSDRSQAHFFILVLKPFTFTLTLKSLDYQLVEPSVNCLTACWICICPKASELPESHCVSPPPPPAPISNALWRYNLQRGSIGTPFLQMQVWFHAEKKHEWVWNMDLTMLISPLMHKPGILFFMQSPLCFLRVRDKCDLKSNHKSIAGSVEGKYSPLQARVLSRWWLCMPEMCWRC